MKRCQLLFFFVNLILLSNCFAQAPLSCPKSPGYQRVHHINGYAVRLFPGEKESATDRCRGSVTLPGARPAIFARGWMLWIDNISGQDINEAGIPDVVFGEFTGEGNCCFEYTIVSLGKHPAVVRTIRNQLPVRFQTESDGSVSIRAGDGSFELFLLPRGQAVIPEVIMRLSGSQLKNISSEHREEYDEKIAKARNELSAASLEKFRLSDFHKKMYTDQTETVKRVLTIVLNYLYSGREKEAWQAFDEMWPASDRDRIRNLIEERQPRPSDSTRQPVIRIALRDNCRLRNPPRAREA